MLIELHCSCGHRQAMSPEKLPPKVRCSACKQALQFCGSVRKLSDVKWLTVGGQTGAPRLAVPIPVGIGLTLGRSPSGWLSLPGEDIEDAQTELQIAEDARVVVKHLAGDGGTWINRARIVEGVLCDKDRLRIGPYVMGLLGHDAIIASVQASIEDDVEVEVEIEDSAPKAARGKAKRSEPEDDADLDREVRRASADEGDDGGLVDYQSGWSTGQKIRMVVSVALILGVTGYLAKGYFFPPISEEMPSETVFYCPADGTPVKSEWSASAGAPKCPVCGQRCVGELKYKSEVTPAAARAAQAPTTQAAPSEKSAVEVAASQPTTKPVKKKSSSKKRSSKKKKKKPTKKPESGGSN
jgi:hypothetical protein